MFDSYNENDKSCHVPHDGESDRATPLGLHGQAQDGYKSYFMKQRIIPTFSEEHSGLGKVYWRNEVDDLANNLDLYGVNSLLECYVACQLTTVGSCWVFR